MDPYRSAPRHERAEAPRDPGIVGEVIAQFADPLAFYRELVQNAIDAGSASVDIKLEYDEGAGVLRVGVRDRGEGMTRDILENQLLVLFRSTKDKDDTKIGKFGIGFASVLAPSPEVVVVNTSRDGRRLVLHLNRDLTYQIYDAGPATQTGTTVEVELAMRADEVGGFADRSVAALARWCRHASVPIEISVQAPGVMRAPQRIDQPIGLVGALVEVRGRSADGKLLAVVGITTSATAYTGFFNHGLMLHETTEPLLGNLSVKLQDARLGHTLSRDDVRRDANFERALELARSLVENQLPAAAATALRGAAEAGDHARWWTLVVALAGSKVELGKRAWCFPLVEPINERRAIAGNELGKRVWGAARSSAVTQLLAIAGEIVVTAPAEVRAALRGLLDQEAGCELRDVETELTCVAPIERTAEDVALTAILHELFAATHRAPSQIVVAQLSGVYADVLAVTADPGATGPHLVDREQAMRSPFDRRRLPLVLSEAHPWYRAARGMDPRIGASLLARVLLVRHDLLDVSRSTALLESALAAIGVAT